MNERVTRDVESFSALVDSAEKAASQNEGVRAMSALLNQLHTGLDSIVSEHGLSILIATDQTITEPYNSLVAALDSTQAIIGKVSGEDREQGDSLARRLTAAIEGDWIEDADEVQRVNELLARWTVSAPEVKSSGRGRKAGATSSAPTLGFTLQVKCENHGWTGRDSTSVNSARWAALKHLEKVHGGKPAKGNPIWQGLTAALNKCAQEGAQHCQGGGFLVDRLAS